MGKAQCSKPQPLHFGADSILVLRCARMDDDIFERLGVPQKVIFILNAVGRKGNGVNVLFSIRGNSIRRGARNSALYNATRQLNVVELAAVLYVLGEISAQRPIHAVVPKR
jgi:hypothetical protein